MSKFTTFKPDVGVKTNYSIADGAHLELFEIYKIFDNNDKVGLINACGEVMPPRNAGLKSFISLVIRHILIETALCYWILWESHLKSPYQHSMKQVYKLLINILMKLRTTVLYQVMMDYYLAFMISNRISNYCQIIMMKYNAYQSRLLT
jgi:hypothetical protein